jgi:hypothetical protein
MPDLREDLRSTEASILRDAQRIVTIESEKASLDAADPDVARLSAQVEQLSVGVRDKAAAERELADDIADADIGSDAVRST